MIKSILLDDVPITLLEGVGGESRFALESRMPGLCCPLCSRKTRDTPRWQRRQRAFRWDAGRRLRAGCLRGGPVLRQSLF